MKHRFFALLMFVGLAAFVSGCVTEPQTSNDDGLETLVSASDFNLYGKTLDDEDFDWQSLRGKYVLVKFTATWCPPCKTEIPGMSEVYEKYRDKGFEIVSVYIWERGGNEGIRRFVEQEKLPWIIISEPLTENAGLPPQGERLGVPSVPTMLIVDKEGNVHATNTRGEKLKTELKKLFGE